MGFWTVLIVGIVVIVILILILPAPWLKAIGEAIANFLGDVAHAVGVKLEQAANS